jgi:hypothetical protein
MQVGGDTLALKTARRQLILQLAAAALVDDGPLPGADAEYHRAREAQAALFGHETPWTAHGPSEVTDSMHNRF